ncbi:MAG TPA: NHLP bacteriocin export ABC transporter permease/ATPase subunit, partial [Planctomycetota bacterium]|nr:NHLP bacteriocin export ABC transporter permease/ATPase subunit [Planctomycetota bacterium]
MPLDDPDAIDVVKSGAVAVFAVARDDAAGAHARRYLFTADAGAALFGLAPDAAPHGLLAVSLGVSCFLRVPWETLAPAAPGAEHGRGLIEGWARRLASSLAAIPAPAANQKLAGGKHKVKDGRTFQSDGGAVAWVTVREGRARWLGLDGFAVDASSGPVCLCEGMWLAADGPVEVEVRRTEEVADLATLRAALALHQATVLRAVAVIEARERAALAQRLRESDARSERVTGDALAELASVLEPRGAPLPEGGSPVFIAAAAVGQAIGAVIRPPGASEDLGRTKNPLDAIARASRLRTRTVILRAGFWEEDCGPLVAKVAAGAKPVALLPRGPGRYELFDPADRSRRPLDRALAETLEPVATMLYRPFPDRALRVLDLLSFSLRGYGRELALMVILTVAGTLLGMFVPLATSVLIDRAIPGGDRALLAQVALGLF